MPTELTNAQLKSIENQINDSIEEYSVKTLSDEPRNHLGMSEIGKSCSRQIWYKFRWFSFEQYDGRMLRLFKRGHREEAKFINMLEGIGIKTFQHDENGKQFRATGVMGHYGGSCDGQAITPWSDQRFLLEFKTHNTKSFVNYVSKGLLKSKPQHFDQMCSYGYKMNLQYGIYFPENKNDDDIQVTVLKLDHNRGKQLEDKADYIIRTQVAPDRISNNPAFFECTYCHFAENCFRDKLPEKNCRSCQQAIPVEDGQWHCTRWNSVIPNVDYIKAGCDNWTPL